MSALPKAVRKQIAASNKVATEYYAALKGEQPDPNAPPAGDPPAGDPPAGDPPVGDPPSGDPQNLAPTPTPPPTPINQDGFETKYKVLQGKYNAEVPRLQNQVRELSDTSRNMREQLTATQNLLASLSAQQTPAPANAPASVTVKRLITDKEIEQFGPDLLDFIKRASAEHLLPTIESRVTERMAPVVAKIDQTANGVARVANRAAKTDQETVLALLDDKIPTWRDMNEDPAFLEWLDQVDPFSGYQRGKLLEQAFGAFDGPRVVAFFRGYLNEHAALNPPPAPPAAGAPAPKPQKELKDFVAPGAPKTGAAVAPDGSGKRVWTRAEIGRFYEDARAGKYRTKLDEQKRIEADIFAAQREGRIR